MLSGCRPASMSFFPAASASRIPLSVRGTSVQPVKRFSRFHRLSPCLSRMSVEAQRISPYRSAAANKCIDTRIAGPTTQFLLDAHQLIVLFDALSPAGCPGFQMTGTQGHRHIRDEGIHGFTTAVGYKCSPSVFVTQRYGIERLAQHANLIELNERCTGKVFTDTALDVFILR